MILLEQNIDVCKISKIFSANERFVFQLNKYKAIKMQNILSELNNIAFLFSKQIN